MCLAEFAQAVDGAFFLELRAGEEYAAVGSNTSVFTLRVSDEALGIRPAYYPNSTYIALHASLSKGRNPIQKQAALLTLLLLFSSCRRRHSAVL
jgi:hypothetical protein